MYDAQALAAAAGRRLYHHRVADLARKRFCVRVIANFADEARHDRHTRGTRERLGFDLVAHRGDGFCIRPDEDDADRGESFGKALAFGKEAVARMDRFRAGVAASLQDFVEVEIRSRRRRRADGNRFIRHFDMKRARVRVGIDGDRSDPHPPRRLDDPAGDLTPIGYEDFPEHAPARM